MRESVSKELKGKSELSASPRMVLMLGKAGEITESSDEIGTAYSVKILPERKPEGMIQLDMVISRSKGGRRELLNKSRVVTMLNTPAFVEKRTDGQPSVKVTVVPSL